MPKDLIRCSPSQGPHGKVIVIPAVIHLQLFCKVLKGIKQVGGIEPFIVLPVAAFYLSIMPGSKGPDDFVADPMHFQVFLEESGLFPVSGKAVGKFRPIVCLDTFDRTGKGF